MIVDETIGHLDKIRQVNAGIIYQLIDMYGPISRIDLSKKAQLVPASITKIARELVDGHLITEYEYQEVGSRGRPAIGLMLETEGWHYLAVRIHYGRLVLALHDLGMSTICEDNITLPTDTDFPFLATLIYEIEQFFQRHRDKLERLTAVAITLPGIIDPKLGIVHKMPFYQVNDLPIADILRETIGVPVFIQQDIATWTLAEFLFGAATRCNNVIQLSIDNQVSAAVLHEGNLLHALSVSAVEIGHYQIIEQGERCYCGKKGCLETVTSIDNLLRIAKQRAQIQPDSRLNQLDLTIEQFCQAIKAGDTLAYEMIQTMSDQLGRVLALMVNVFNPKMLVIGSPLNMVADVFYPLLLEKIKQYGFLPYQQELILVPCHFTNESTIPAAALIKQALYNGSLLGKLLQG